METLPINFYKNGYNYVQVHRGMQSCVYRQEVSADVCYYETFIIRIKPARVLKGKKLETREWFPHNEAFGDWAWTFRSYEAAVRKFNDLEISIEKAPNARIG